MFLAMNQTTVHKTIIHSSKVWAFYLDPKIRPGTDLKNLDSGRIRTDHLSYWILLGRIRGSWTQPDPNPKFDGYPKYLKFLVYMSQKLILSIKIQVPSFVSSVSFSFAAMYGVAVAALGMLSTIATGLAIDAYGPISDNAGGIAEMAGMSHRIRERTDVLDEAGNTTAAVGKMVDEVRRQFNTIPGLMEGTVKPDYATCVKISTDTSIKEMILPGCLVMNMEGIVFSLFSYDQIILKHMIIHVLVSCKQIAIFASNTGGAWDNAKKYTEAGASEHTKSLGTKGSETHKAAVIGDTIGGPLKDTSGPSLNILIKLIAVESLVFAPFFATHGGILFKYL
ncbi:LOW QUALITY PROTEIN: hypothetical protein N665_0037s0030 [Sinapis alba]|nr:LOW QUALITY PROTEIN: hypothetical protein N665_0037s0030 [Sinapis alba]